MAGLMYPAYQKYYSAICNLRRFGAEKSFFDNISSLDNFFSEYRSVTLVMQKSLAHTTHMETYNRVSYGIWDKFFNDQRVKAIHTHPVEFSKVIDITVYYPNEGITIFSETFTVENDVPFTDLIVSLKNYFKDINSSEVFFSAKFLFIEKETGVNLWDKLIAGISTMQEFMSTMYSEIGEVCPLCEELRSEISNVSFFEMATDILHVVDYVYYPKKEIFDRANRFAMVFSEKINVETKRLSMKSFLSYPYLNYGNSAFNKFILMNTIIGTSNLMPTIMIVYKDGTYEMDVFHADIKTTIYRKINEVAETIRQNLIQEVFVMITYVCMKYEDSLVKLTSKERMAKATQEYLVFMKADCELNEEECIFNGEYISQIEYIAHQIKHGKLNKLDVGAVNMMPIVEAFKERKAIGEE